jgi:hypothetical protein
MVVIPYICGKGFIDILRRTPKGAGYTKTDYLLTGALISVGLTEAAHLFGVFGHANVHTAMKLMGVCFAAAALAGLAASALIGNKAKNHNAAAPLLYENGSREIAKGDIYAAFLAVVIFIICFVITQVDNNIYLDGDMTVETVNSFISTDSFYTVNPLTGTAYTVGVPSRLKILCLPSLYTFFSKTFHISPAYVVWRIVPAFVLICCAAAYYNLSEVLFKNDSGKRNMFMVLVGLVILLGNYMYGMDGFMALESGFRGTAFRNLVLVPYTISLTFRKKWLQVLMCVIAEACVAWTLYGAGVCLFIAVGLTVAERVVHDV